MEIQEVTAKVKIYCKNREEELDAIFDTGSDNSYISPDLAVDFKECIIALPKPMSMGTADRDSELIVDKVIATEIEFDKSGVKPVELLIPRKMKPKTFLIGRKELDSLDIKFTSDGPKVVKTQYSDVLL